MRNFALDFQPRRPGVLPLILLCAGCLLCADAWLGVRNRNEQLDDLQERIAQAQRLAQRLAVASRDAAQREATLPAEQNKALRQAAAAIRIDWEALYRHIDQATLEDIALLAVIPNAAKKTLQISGEARSMQVALKFIEALRRQPLSQVSLLSHKVKADDPQHPIVFEIAATWSTAI
jgi:hypothetical protein